MTSRRSLFTSVLLSAALGCGGSSPQPASPEAAPEVAQAAPATGEHAEIGEDADESSAELAAHHRHHHHGGFSMFIAMSLDGLAVAPEHHDAVMKIQSDLRAKMKGAHDAEKQVLLALADGVAAGQVDHGKIDPALAQLGTSAAGIHDSIADSLNTLHATLSAPERQALVDKVEANMAVWHHTNSPEDAGEKGKHGPVAELGESLGLTADQIDQIRASYKAALASAPHYDRAEAQAHFTAFATAFASDKFDAHTLTTGGSVNAHMATWGLTRTVLLYTAAAPVLKPEQRAKAADELRRHANYKHNDSET